MITTWEAPEDGGRMVPVAVPEAGLLNGSAVDPASEPGSITVCSAVGGIAGTDKLPDWVTTSLRLSAFESCARAGTDTDTRRRTKHVRIHTSNMAPTFAGKNDKIVTDVGSKWKH